MAKGQSLQDPFLNALRKERVPVSIYLVNGIKLQGQIDSFDQFVVLLRNSVSQMVYKHAISTVVPARNVRLPTSDDDAGRRGSAGLTRREQDKDYLIDRLRSGEHAILVCIGLGRTPDPDRVEEFTALAQSAGAQVLDLLVMTRKSADPRFLLGSGKVSELRERVAATGADLVLVDHQLSPSQERNLEQELKCRVLDRSGLILDIFAQRARSFEGKLQVELAQLQHLSTRLVRGWTHLERQKGGIGLRGPGETQLETDRRLVGRRIKTLNDRLDRVLVQRDTTRRDRQRRAVPTVALVGYTNAGKSTLFNRLTTAEAFVADQLFATLDPTVRRLGVAAGLDVALADTVGFVRDLPHELVAAFRSTLQEARDADLLLHVIDAADPERADRIAQVDHVLDSIGAGDLPQIAIYNKIDRTGEQPRIEFSADGRADRVWLSAQTGAGVGLLREALQGHFGRDLARCQSTRPRTRRTRSRAFPRGRRGARRTRGRRRWFRARRLDAPTRYRTHLPRGGSRSAGGGALSGRIGLPTIDTYQQRRQRLTSRSGRSGSAGLASSPINRPLGAVRPMAWNEPGKNRNPWGNRPERGAADLDEALRRLQRRLAGIFGGGGGGNGNGDGSGSSTGGRARGFGIGTIAAALLVIWASDRRLPGRCGGARRDHAVRAVYPHDAARHRNAHPLAGRVAAHRQYRVD